MSKKIIGATVGTPTSPRKIADELQPVLCTPQALTEAQKAHARANLGLEAPATAYLYNGIQLPPLPDWDKASRPYAFIREMGSLYGAIYLFFAKEIQYKQGERYYTIGVVDCESYVCYPEHEAPQWTRSLHYDDTMIGDAAKTLWANFDVLNADGSVCLSASEPVPVYVGGGSSAGEAPVQSVNGKTGEVHLSAADVNARPDDWMPTAQEVGALPSTYTPPNQTAEQVGADPKGTAASAVSQHNTADDSHNDIRLELKAINDRLTAFFDSDNQTLDELSEIVAYITSNKSLIDAITTSKVSVTDIIDNLATNVANKPLSAAQGVVLKGLIDTLSGNLANYQPKGDYALRDELPAVPVKSVNGKTGDVSLGAADVKARPDSWMPTASDVGAVHSSELPAAINTALAQAKESGQFDGDPGAPGVSPHIGANGNWYIGSADTGVKAQGAAGAAGRGIKSIVRTSGTGEAGTTDTYTVTYTDNTTSTISVYNGKNGTPGKTPVRGIDYWTPADQEAMAQQVIVALGTPVFGRVEEGNKIITTGKLAAGIYEYWFEDENGKQVLIGTLENVKYVNQLPKAINADGTLYNGGQGWKTGYRLNSSGAEAALDDMEVTGFIPVKYGDVVYMNGVGWKPGQGNAQQTYLWCYDINKNCIAYGLASGIATSQTPIKDSNGNLIQFTADGTTFYTTKQGNIQDMAYFRLNCESITADSIITVNQPIE